MESVRISKVGLQKSILGNSPCVHSAHFIYPTADLFRKPLLLPIIMHPLRKRKESDPDQESPAQAKRPRIDTIHVPFHRQSPQIFSPLRRTPSDIEDIGIVVTSSDPGPSSGSLLRERHIPLSPPPKRPPLTPTTPIVNSLQPDYSSPHIPPLSPLINRQTLRELDLDVIIRNPVLRAQ